MFEFSVKVVCFFSNLFVYLCSQINTMQSKEKNLKTICTENNTPEIPLPAEKVAYIAGVSESLVKKIRNGNRNAHTP